jgi:hypothetical protein
MKEIAHMLRYEHEQMKINRIRELTSLNVDEFTALVEPFESEFVRHMDAWTMEGRPRTGRRYSQYTTCPLPTPEDRLLFILSYLKVATLQVVQGALFGMSQSNANKWIHVLLPVLHQTLITSADMPARHIQALTDRLAALCAPDSTADHPLFIMMGPNDRFPVRKTRMSKARVIAARKSVIP